MSEYESIQGTRVKYLTSDPTLDSSTEGQVWYNSTSGTNKALVQIKSFSSSGAIPTQFYYPGGVGGQTDTLGIAGVGPTPQPAHNLCIEYSGYTWRAQPNLNTNRIDEYRVTIKINQSNSFVKDLYANKIKIISFDYYKSYILFYFFFLLSKIRNLIKN